MAVWAVDYSLLLAEGKDSMTALEEPRLDVVDC
jgi:hypothetical protein